MNFTSNRYVLLTAARNEEAYIRKTIESVVSQTVPPVNWIIVSDGSTDGTDRIVRGYMDDCPFLRFARLEPSGEHRGFSSKVFALAYAFSILPDLDYDFIGILDGDISVAPNYYETIMKRFQENPKLGIAGGYIFEKDEAGVFRTRKHNRKRSVAGAIQLFRKACYLEIGGMKPIEFGGEDTYAEILARMNGWEVSAYPEIPTYHYKSGNQKRGLWKDRTRMGRLDFVMGYHPLYELMKYFNRISEPPFFLGATTRLIGYFLAMIGRAERIPPKSVIRHIRKEHWQTLRRAIRAGKID